MALIFIGDNDLHGRYAGEEHLLAEGLLGIERDVGGMLAKTWQNQVPAVGELECC